MSGELSEDLDNQHLFSLPEMELYRFNLRQLVFFTPPPNKLTSNQWKYMKAAKMIQYTVTMSSGDCGGRPEYSVCNENDDIFISFPNLFLFFSFLAAFLLQHPKIVSHSWGQDGSAWDNRWCVGYSGCWLCWGTFHLLLCSKLYLFFLFIK